MAVIILFNKFNTINSLTCFDYHQKMSTQSKKRRTAADSIPTPTSIATYLRDLQSSSSSSSSFPALTLFPFSNYGGGGGGEDEGDEGKFEGKEEKQRGRIGSIQPIRQLQSLQQLQQLQLPPIVPSDNEVKRNWFCADTWFAKQTCIQRLPKDVENWTTQFRSGLEGGMSEEECTRTCGQSIMQSQPFNSSSSSGLSSSSGSSFTPSMLSAQSVMRSAYRIPGSQYPVIVPGVNSAVVNDLVASMLKSNELANLLPSSRANYVGMSAAQQNKLELETLLTGLISASKLHLNDKYYLNRIIQLLRGRGVRQGQTQQVSYVSKFVLYPLLVEALPKISIVNPSAFFALLNELPHLEKLQAILNSNRLRPASVKQLINQGVFQFDDDELAQKTAESMELWNLRDGIIFNFIIRNLLSPQMIDGFFELRHQEEVRSPLRNSDDVVLTPNLHNLFGNIRIAAIYLPETVYQKLLRLFLERGYYLPLNLTGELANDPLNIAIQTNDPGLIEQVAKHYNNEQGVARIKTMMNHIVQVSLPAAKTENEKILLPYTYNTLNTILNDFTATS